MRRFVNLLCWAALFMVLYPAQAQETFPTYVGGLTQATTPFLGTEQLYVLQSGNSRRATMSNILGQPNVQTGPCSGLTSFQTQVNTAGAPANAIISYFDGNQCVPFLSMNQSLHTVTYAGQLPGPVVVVTSPPYNADPTGVNDSTTAIQTAINALGNTGGEVWFPPGTYKISSTLSIGNGTVSSVSARQGIVLKGIPNPDNTSTALTGLTATGGPRLLWAGANSLPMVSILGVLQGWGAQNIVLDCATTTGSIGLDVISAQFGKIDNLTVNNCFIGIDETTVAPFGSVTNTNSMHNTWTNTTINLSTMNNAIAWIMTSGSLPNSDTSFEQAFNTTVTFPTTTNAMNGLYFQGTDTIRFYGVHIFGGTAASMRCVVFDYSSLGNGFPTAINLHDFNSGPACASGATFANVGAPLAGTVPQFVQIQEANGLVCPTVANITCQGTHTFNLGVSGANGVVGTINLAGSTSGLSTIATGPLGGLGITAQTNVSTNFNDGTNGLVAQVIGVGSTAANFAQISGAATNNSPKIAAAGTDTNISFVIGSKGTGGVYAQGVSDGSGGVAGFDGELITATQSTPQNLTIGTSANTTSISLTAGDWDVMGVCDFNNTTNISTTTASLAFFCSVSTTSATNDSTDLRETTQLYPIISASTGTPQAIPRFTVGASRFNLTTTTTVFLVQTATGGGTITFGSGTNIQATGTVRARRVR